MGFRKDREVKERVHDTYKSRQKMVEPTLCPQCGALFQKGRWIWGLRPPNFHETTCPACHRTKDKYPAGFLHVGGAFFNEHRDELLNLVHNEEALAKKDHPLSRLMGVEEKEGGVQITTTDTHLPRRIGEALKHAYQGELQLHYGEGEYSVRVSWKR
jgi:NMD protein affecting ribosome stability and mRNA decay